MYHEDIGRYVLFPYVTSSLHYILKADLLDYSTRASIAELLYTILVYDYHSPNLSI